MKKIIINSIVVLNVIFSFMLILKLVGVLTLCWWIFTLPYLMLLLVFICYYDLSDRLSVREFILWLYLILVFVLSVIGVITFIGDQSIERGFHQSYSGSIAPTCPDNMVKWYIFENLNCK